MKHLSLCLFLFVALATGASAASRGKGEYVLLVGGPSMYEWEKYKLQPHDHWWANFVRAARIRTEQIQAQYGKDQTITWLIYRQGYVDRAVQEKQDLISHIDSIRDKFGIHLVWFDRGREVIDYLNHGQPREQIKIAGFEYFGHSNKACFMFDYSNNIDSACKSWLHEKELRTIDRRDFAHGAYVKSWGCHTGESMSAKWYTATGVHMIGAVGKTQFMMEELPILTSQNGRWVN
ncbi:MAG: hypothetical protein QOG67_2833 [Verrucomicrobiota bacterium]|jgi:hypothetical protein